MARHKNAKHVSIHPEIAGVPFSSYVRDSWTLEVRCWSCGHLGWISGPDLVARYGPSGTTGELFTRLPCGQCGRTMPAMTAIIVGEKTPER